MTDNKWQKRVKLLKEHKRLCGNAKGSYIYINKYSDKKSSTFLQI